MCFSLAIKINSMKSQICQIKFLYLFIVLLITYGLNPTWLLQVLW